MDRKTCEKLLAQTLELAVSIYHSYNPEGKYLSLYYREDEYERVLNINNAYWEKDGEEEYKGDIDNPIRFFTATDKED